MNYKFVGNHFFFTKYCPTLEDVKNTIDRHRRAFKCRDFYISNKIKAVTDELGVVIYTIPSK